MKPETIRLVPGRAADDAALRGRVQRIISVLTAIESGELLAASPSCPVSRANHLAAVDLLAMAAEEAHRLAAELDLRDAE